MVVKKYFKSDFTQDVLYMCIWHCGRKAMTESFKDIQKVSELGAELGIWRRTHIIAICESGGGAGANNKKGWRLYNNV